MAILRFLWFLLLHDEKYKSKLSKITQDAVYIFFALLGLDLLKIIPTGTMPNEKQWEIRILGLLVIFAMWLLSFVILLSIYYKKYKTPHKLTDKELDNILKYMNLKK